jgi:hypothetical protein
MPSIIVDDSAPVPLLAAAVTARYDSSPKLIRPGRNDLCRINALPACVFQPDLAPDMCIGLSDD